MREPASIQKMEDILNIKASSTRNEDSTTHLIDIFNNCRESRFCRSELLAPLICPTSIKVKYECLPYHQQAFEKIKKVIETERLLIYPDFNKPFHLYTDTSDHQLTTDIIRSKNLLPLS
jgi:hypothetical protein